MSNLILDEIEKSEPQGLPSHSKYYIARYIIVIYAIYILFFLIYYLVIDPKFGFGIFIFFLLIKLLPTGFLLYYNIVHAMMEQKQELSIPKFSNGVIIFFIFLFGLSSFFIIIDFIKLLVYDFLNLDIFRSFILSVCAIIILLREKDYYFWTKLHK